MPKTSEKLVKRRRRHARQKARIVGTASRPRLIVFRSLMHIHAQIIDDQTGKTIVAAHDMGMKKGTKKEKAAEVGKMLGEAAKKAGIEACIFDRNGYKYHGRIQALADGVREAGLKF